MTWTQFKARIEEQMREKGIDEDTQVEYIDTADPFKAQVRLRNGRVIIE